MNGPVAVNDIGYVAWQDPDHVLDLWGLASPEVLATRLSEPEKGWAGPLVAERGIALAMIYDDWLGEAVPPEWQRLGKLHLDVPTAFLGGREVAFYATEQWAIGPILLAISKWEADLPSRARFVWAEGGSMNHYSLLCRSRISCRRIGILSICRDSSRTSHGKGLRSFTPPSFPMRLA